jgi:CheY-like chemotaxis protein
MLDFITSYNKNTVPVINNKNTQLSNVKILAAEDNKMNQMLLKMLFEQWQLNIEIVENGEIATEKLMNGNYDLVLMDIQMPVMDGYTAVRKIRTELKSKIPVIAMTANVLPGEKERCLDAGMTGYISKPINESELYSLLMLHGNQNSQINKEPANSSTPEFINKDYLNRIFSGNSEFIKEMANQFIIQYAKELDTLGEYIKNKDASSANKLGHHMKTTVSSMNDQSPLIHSLMAIENASDSETGWNILNYNYDMLLKSREKVLEEAKKLIDTGN